MSRLHATAAAYALGDALTALHHAATAEAAQIASDGLDVPDGLRSPVWGRRVALGVHSDPTATVLLHDRPPAVNRARVLLVDLGGELSRLAAPLPGTGHPLDRIRAAIPGMPDRVCRRLAEALGRLDEVARRHLRLPPARELLAGLPCRECRVRDVWTLTGGPVSVWVVACGACGRAWPRADVLGAVGGAAPTP